MQDWWACSVRSFACAVYTIFVWSSACSYHVIATNSGFTVFFFLPAFQQAASDPVKSRYFPIFPFAEVVPHCFISCSPASMICSLRQGEREHFRCTGPVGWSVFMLEVLYHSTFSFKTFTFQLADTLEIKTWCCMQKAKTAFTAGIKSVL